MTPQASASKNQTLQTKTKDQMSKELAVVNPETQIVEFSAFGNIKCFEDAQRMAKALCSSTIVPTNYQGEANIGSCVIALEISNRIGASVLAVMQNLYIVHGKPGWSSQFLISCVNASRKFSPLRYKMTGEKGKDSWGCIAWATDKTGEVLESPEVTIEMAKAEGWYGKNGSKWKTMPELMLRYRTATLFARLYAPELTMGIQTTEEISDVIDVEATTTTVPASPSFAPRVLDAPAAAPATTTKPKATTKPKSPPPHDTANQTKQPATPATPPAPKPEEKQPEAEVTKTEETELAPAPAAPAADPNDTPEIVDLKAAIAEGGVTPEQVVAFATKKGVLKEGADKDLATLSDILDSKIPVLAKMIRTKGQALKEMKEG